MRKITLFLSIIMIVSVISGCSGSGNTGNSGSNSGGENAGSKDNSKPLKLKVTTINFGETPTDKLIQNEWIKRTSDAMGRELDIDFEYINIADYGEKLKILMAGGDLPDVLTIFGMKNEEVIKYGELGILEELTQHAAIMPNYAKILEEAENVKNIAYTAEGKVFGFYNLQLTDTTPALMISDSAGIRYDILKKHDIKLPTTQEEFYQVAKQIKELYPDSFPIVQLEEWSKIQTTLFSGNHTAEGRYYNGNEFVYGPLEDGYKEALMTLNKWYTDGLISPDYFAHTSAEGMASVANGTAFMAPNIYPEYSSIWASQYPDQEWVVIPGLKNANYGEPWNKYSQQSAPKKLNSGTSVVISAKSKVKEDAIKFVDLMFSDEIAEVLTWGVEGTTFQKNADGTRELLPQFIGGEGSDELIELALPASGRSRAGIFPTPQNFSMLWDNFNGKNKFFNGTEIVETQSSVFAREGGVGIVSPNSTAPSVQLTVDENEEYANIMTAVDTFAKEELVKFIKGARSFDEWNKYLEQINAVGNIQKALDIYNSKL